MNYTQARKYLARAERHGYVAYYSGICCIEGSRKNTWGINVDGDGHDGRRFGRPQIIWDAEKAEELFPSSRRGR